LQRPIFGEVNDMLKQCDYPSLLVYACAWCVGQDLSSMANDTPILLKHNEWDNNCNVVCLNDIKFFQIKDYVFFHLQR
jgi:hypothetical protein